MESAKACDTSTCSHSGSLKKLLAVLPARAAPSSMPAAANARLSSLMRALPPGGATTGNAQ
jgi:hypothetical protein